MTYNGADISMNAVAAGDLDYYSKDASIVEVLENGILTAVQPGETTITVLAKSTGLYNSAVLKIPVKVNKAEAGLLVEQTDLELTIGEDDQEWGQIITSTQSDATMQYEALDKTVVSTGYTNGRIRAFKEGQTQIRVFQKETVYYNPAETYVNVKVNRGKSEIAGLQDRNTVNRKDRKVSFTFQKKGNNTTKVTVSDSSVAYIARSPYKLDLTDSTNYQFDVALCKAGSVTITVTNEENDQYEGSSVSFTLIVVDDDLDNEDDFNNEDVLDDGDEVTANNQNYIVLSGSERTMVYSGPVSQSATSVEIAGSVTVDDLEYRVVGIADNAFKNCKKLKSVTIPQTGITSIGTNAFYNCSSLKSITLPQTVTDIGAKAFYKNTSLKQITIPAKVCRIGTQAFYGCKKLKKVMIKTTKLTSKTVGAKAFKGIAGNATIKVPKSKEKTYKTMLKKKGITGKKQRIKK